MDTHLHHNHPSTPLWLFLILVLPVVLYIFGVVQQYRIVRHWSFWRTGSFVIGVSLLGAALSGSIQQQAHHSFTAHMVQHLLIGMFAPTALVLGKPVTLALRTMPTNSARLVVKLFNINVFHWLINPVTTLMLNIGGMYILYLTPLYEISLDNNVVHYLVHWHFLVAGYLFAWSIIEADPIPHRPHYHFRLFILFASIAAHALLAKLIYAQIISIEPDYEDADIKMAALVMYYGGDIAELIIALLLFDNLYRHRKTH